MIDDTEKKGSKNMNESIDFKGVWIPKKVWLDTRLNALEKIILTEIDSLDNGEEGCYASNEHLAEFCQCSKTKVSTAIRKLIDCGYIYVQNFDGRKRKLKSRLSNFERQNIKNCNAEYHNLKESNIDINTDNNTNNTLSKKERKSKSKSYDEQIAEYTQNEDLQNALKAFLQMRSFIKKPMTEYALKLMLKKLDEIGNTDDAKIAILNQSITNNWQGIFPLKDGNTKQEKQPEKKYDQNGYESEEELMAMFYGK